MIRFFCAAFSIVLASVVTARGQPSQPAATESFSAFALNDDRAIDGSAFTLEPLKGALSRQIVSPDGTVQQTLFTFLSQRLGTVSEHGAVTGLFVLDGTSIATEYSDGRSETLLVDLNHVSMIQKAPSGEITCTSWYPSGHPFSVSERKAALAQYAQRLGVSDPRYGAAPQLKSGCSAAFKKLQGAHPPETAGVQSSTETGDTLNMIMGQVLALYRGAPAVPPSALASGAFDRTAWDGFDRFYSSFLAGHEGGYVENDGNGSPANFGINQGANPDVDVGNLTQADAEQLLYRRYWLASGADRLPPALAIVHGDTAINLGVRTATQLLAQSAGDPNTYLNLREARYRAIAAPDPDKARWLDIWLARNEDLRNLIRSGGQAEEVPAL